MRDRYLQIEIEFLSIYTVFIQINHKSIWKFVYVLNIIYCAFKLMKTRLHFNVNLSEDKFSFVILAAEQKDQNFV